MTCWNWLRSSSSADRAGLGCVYSVKFTSSTSMSSAAAASVKVSQYGSPEFTTPMRTGPVSSLDERHRPEPAQPAITSASGRARAAAVRKSLTGHGVSRCVSVHRFSTATAD